MVKSYTKFTDDIIINKDFMLDLSRSSQRKHEINMIILHHTIVDLDQTLAIFRGEVLGLDNKPIDVSAHFVIDKEGEILQLVDEERVAWHAGVSGFNNDKALNKNSIGIELVNNGQKNFSDKQINSLIKLLGYLQKKYNIMPANILGHNEIAFRRKVDPSILFPWKILARHGHSIWFNENAISKTGQENHVFVEEQDIIKCQNTLNQLGYDIDVTGEYDSSTQALIAVFKDKYQIDIPAIISYVDNDESVKNRDLRPIHHSGDYLLWDNLCQQIAEDLLLKKQ